jgi:hypothetical protein
MCYGRHQSGLRHEIAGLGHSSVNRVLQVYVRLPQRPSSNGLLASKTRPLATKLEALVQVLLHYMLDKWGGTDEASCTARMVAQAQKISGGVEAS